MDLENTYSSSGSQVVSNVPFRGIHHLALTTDDMAKTTDFYVNILGMTLVHAMKVPEGVGTTENRGNPPYECIRHYFFDMGNDSLWAFFEIPVGEKPQTDRDAIGGMQHVAFSVSEKQFDNIQQRLKTKEVVFDGPVEILPGMFSIYFHDPNNIRLEACCMLTHKNSQKVVQSVTQTKAVALEELRTISDDEDWLNLVTANLS
ncbi:MAG: VOC family protein [Pseudomonadota bacterium]|nr:VOC family protein [Pseudomonadota bacterium]